MPDKIITQRAQGYGPQPVTATVQIDGVTVLDGTIPTQDTPPPMLPDQWTPELGVNAWSWTVDSSFDGTQTMTVSVNNGRLYLCDAFYSLSDEPGNVYALSFPQTQGNVQFSDPFTAVTVNSLPLDPARDADRTGQWVWQLSAADQFSCTVNIVPSLPSLSYVIFDSQPSSMAPGATGTFQVSIPSISPDYPLPRTYGWQVINQTTQDSDFVATFGNVQFTTANSTFSISTTNAASAGIFSVRLLSITGNILGQSGSVIIT